MDAVDLVAPQGVDTTRPSPTSPCRLPCRSTTDGRLPAYVEADEWNLLRHMTELPNELLLFEAEQTIRMHEPAVHLEIKRDKYSRWRDVVISGSTTTYARQRCGACTDDGCALLDAALAFHAAVSPYVAAERSRAA